MAPSTPIIGNSPAIREVLRLIDLFAETPATVLITGESGTGKELVAQALHRNSSRRSRAFVPVNCAAIPRELLESELFGHRKGAFSGAIADRTGRFELAEGGTIFLDEVGDMPLELQSKMLRVLQEGTIDPIGASRQVRVDVRVVAATHRDLEAECAAGRFREDLYYRLNVLPIMVPPLRERVSDVVQLVTHLASRLDKGALPMSLDAEFIRALQSYAWPGNVRELSNLVQRLCVIFPGKRLRRRDVPAHLLPKNLREALAEAAPAAPAGAPLSELLGQPLSGPLNPSLDAGAPQTFLDPVVEPHSIEEIILIANGSRSFPSDGVFLRTHLVNLERKIIFSALKHASGNVSKTAQLLNLQRTTLLQKLNKIKADSAGLDLDQLLVPISDMQ